MNLRLVVLIVLLLLVALFAALNWAAFVDPDDINLVFAHAEAPLGLLLLGFIALLTVLYLVYAVSLRTSGLVEARRYSKDLEAARKVANEVEASRINALRETVESEMAALREAMSAEAEATRARFEESQNVLTAHLAQIDDYIKTVDGGVESDGEAGTSTSSADAAENLADPRDADG
jgi:uncharacterized integral membrane protein